MLHRPFSPAARPHRLPSGRPGLASWGPLPQRFTRGAGAAGGERIPGLASGVLSESSARPRSIVVAGVWLWRHGRVVLWLAVSGQCRHALPASGAAVGIRWLGSRWHQRIIFPNGLVVGTCSRTKPSQNPLCPLEHHVEDWTSRHQARRRTSGAEWQQGDNTSAWLTSSAEFQERGSWSDRDTGKRRAELQMTCLRTGAGRSQGNVEWGWRTEV